MQVECSRHGVDQELANVQYLGLAWGKFDNYHRLLSTPFFSILAPIAGLPVNAPICSFPFYSRPFYPIIAPMAGGQFPLSLPTFRFLRSESDHGGGGGPPPILGPLASPPAGPAGRCRPCLALCLHATEPHIAHDMLIEQFFLNNICWKLFVSLTVTCNAPAAIVLDNALPTSTLY